MRLVGVPTETEVKSLDEKNFDSQASDGSLEDLIVDMRDEFAPIFRQSILWKLEREAPSAWTEHVPFAFWLVDVMRPSTVVELGTHNGVSYSAICQAVKSLGLRTRCYAVDTWKGDEHSGFYPEEIYRNFATFHDRHYSAFSRLVRSTFDEALPHFKDRSIDLLHIDGFHTYEAVRHDFESWFPKLSPDAVILFHDTNVRENNFGVFRLWSEVVSGRLHFNFLHGHGLGVLGLGRNYSNALQVFFDANKDSGLGNSIHEIFSSLGWSARLLNERSTLVQTLTERGREISELRAALVERDGEIARLTQAIIERVTFLRRITDFFRIRRDVALIRDSDLFDADYYLSRNPDVRNAGMDTARHYLHFGWKERRDASAGFSTSQYLRDNPDVARAGVNPLVHYLRHGFREGRPISPRTRALAATPKSAPAQLVLDADTRTVPIRQSTRR
jgi:hypothetical protein